MKKLLIIFNFIILSCCSVFATAPAMTNVTATLIDSQGQRWRNGTWQATFQTPFGNPNTPSNNGNPVIQQYSGVIDNSGSFAASLDDNNVVNPTGSHWVFTLCPNATVPVCSNATVLVTGVSQDLESILSAALIIPVVQTKPTIFRAYSDLEAFGGLGALYVNTTDNNLRLCNTPTGCPGSGWVAASVPSNNPTFTGTVQINGDLNVTGLTTLNTLHVTGISTFDDIIQAKNCIDFMVTLIDFTHVCPQAGGPFAIDLPTSSGVFAVSATSPIVLNPTTGNISCPTCSTGGVTFPLLAPNGSIGAPSYSWSAETDSGWYRASSNHFNFAISGIGNELLLSNTGLEIIDHLTVDSSSLFSNVGITGVLSQTGVIDSISTTYALSGKENSTPSNPGPTLQKGYFKAGKGLCALDSGGIERCTTTATTTNIITPFHFNTCHTSGDGGGSICTGTATLPATQPDILYEVVCTIDSGRNADAGSCTQLNGANPCPLDTSIFNKTTTTFDYQITLDRGVSTGTGGFGVSNCHVGHS